MVCEGRGAFMCGAGGCGGGCCCGRCEIVVGFVVCISCVDIVVVGVFWYGISCFSSDSNVVVVECVCDVYGVCVCDVVVY